MNISEWLQKVESFATSREMENGRVDRAEINNDMALFLDKNRGDIDVTYVANYLSGRFFKIRSPKLRKYQAEDRSEQMTFFDAAAYLRIGPEMYVRMEKATRNDVIEHLRLYTEQTESRYTSALIYIKWFNNRLDHFQIEFENFGELEKSINPECNGPI